MRLFFPLFVFSPSVVSRFWAFRNKGGFKNAIKKIAELFPQPKEGIYLIIAKKITYLLTSLPPPPHAPP
jgi:hypothetical protein